MIWYTYILRKDGHNNLVDIHHHTWLQIIFLWWELLKLLSYELSSIQYIIINYSHQAVRYIPTTYFIIGNNSIYFTEFYED